MSLASHAEMPEEIWDRNKDAVMAVKSLVAGVLVMRCRALQFWDTDPLPQTLAFTVKLLRGCSTSRTAECRLKLSSGQWQSTPPV